MKTAVLLNDTNISDMNYHVMSELNNVVGGENDVFLLVDNVSSRVIQSNFAIINSSRVSSVYNGIVIATSLSTAKTLIKAPTNSVKVFYVYEMDWVNGVFDYNEVYDVLNDPNLIVICRSEFEKSLLENNFGRVSDFVVKEFKLGEIWNLLENTKTC